MTMIKNELLKKFRHVKTHIVFISITTLCALVSMLSSYDSYKGSISSKTHINENALSVAVSNNSQEDIAAITEIIDKNYICDVDWQADGIFYKYYPDVCTVVDITYSLSPSELSKIIDHNDGKAYFQYLFDFYKNLVDTYPSLSSAFETKLKAIEFCIQNNIFVSFSNWRFNYIEHSFYEESSKKAEELRYRAVYNIVDDSINTDRVPSFNQVYAIKLTMEPVFLLVLVYAAFISSRDLPSEYQRKTIRIIYRSPQRRSCILLIKAFSSYIVSLVFSLSSLAITILMSIPFYGMRGLGGFTLVFLGNIVPVNVLVYFFLALLLQSFEIFVIIMLCMSISVFFVNPIPGVVLGTTVSFISAIYSSLLVKVKERFWMKYCFPFSMNVRQYIEFDEKLSELSSVKSVVITAVWILFFGFIILFLEKNRDV